MTPNEAAAWEAQKQGYARGQELARRYFHKEKDPVCWSWDPMPEGGDWWEWHPSMCAVCGSRGNLVIDHDHATGLIRGRLCRSCNTREGSGYAPDRIVKYRQRNPASMWGFREVYWDPFHGEAKPAVPVTLDEIAEVTNSLADFLYSRAAEIAAESSPKAKEAS